MDGCALADIPDEQECCSTSQPTQGQTDNYWRVEFDKLYDIDRVIITGRSGTNTIKLVWENALEITMKLILAANSLH